MSKPDKWRRWIARIRSDVRTAVEQRRVWNEIRRMWVSNPALRVPSDAHQAIAQMYAWRAAIDVRRQLDMDGRAQSLARLLTDLEQNAEQVTRKEFVARSATNPRLAFVLDGTFDKYAGVGKIHLSSRHPRSDLGRLRSIGQPIVKYVNKLVAHPDKTAPPSPRWGDLTRAISLCERLAIKYTLLLTGESWMGLLGTRQFDSEAFFRRPWLRPDWKRVPWPPGMVKREGQLRPALNWMTWADYVRLKKRIGAIRSALVAMNDQDEHAQSPIRRVLDSLGLPSSDAAVQLVRDHLATLGPIWTRPRESESKGTTSSTSAAAAAAPSPTGA